MYSPTKVVYLLSKIAETGIKLTENAINMIFKDLEKLCGNFKAHAVADDAVSMINVAVKLAGNENMRDSYYNPMKFLALYAASSNNLKDAASAVCLLEIEWSTCSVEFRRQIVVILTKRLEYMLRALQEGGLEVKILLKREKIFY
jgi:hypothetical protein